MKRSGTTLTQWAVIGLVAIVAAACPPKNSDPDPPNDPPKEPPPADPVPERYYINDYWPFAIGNHWYYYPDGGDLQYTYDVIEDYSTPDVPAWALKLSTIDLKGIRIKEEIIYFVQTAKLLLATTEKETMAKLIEFADEDPLPDLGDKVDIVAPSYFHSGDRPDDYGRDGFTLTGPFAEMLMYLVCPDVVEIPKPDGFLAEADHHCMVDLGVGECKDGPALVGTEIYAKDIGPLFIGDWILRYAYVNGVEYTDDQD